MELHLPLVLATPTLLCLLAAVAAIVWPRRLVLWPFVLPAALLAAGCLGLLPSRGEIVGPTLLWFRLDVPGLLTNAIALPSAACWLWWVERRAVAARALARPWSLSLWFAAVASVGLTPVPMLAFVVLPFAPLVWRSVATKRTAGLAVVGAILLWPWPHLVDAASGLALAFVAWSLLPSARWQHGLRMLVGLFAGISFARALGLL